MFGRLATPLFPVMDNLHLDSFFFFVPNRLVWNNWVKFMGEQDNPSDSISYSIPQQVSPTGGYAVGSLQDYFGLPTVGQVGVGNTVSHSALPVRAYNLIYNQWFRDQNLQNSVTVSKDDAPDYSAASNYTLLRRGKRHDYFTSALPWPQKGGNAVTLPLGTSAPVISNGLQPYFNNGNQDFDLGTSVSAPYLSLRNNATLGQPGKWGTMSDLTKTGLIADLSSATAATINQLRQSFQIQKLLERDARGGTRYTEIITAHFGVRSPDARLQRPEYLGGGSTLINISPIAQTGGTGASMYPTAMARKQGYDQVLWTDAFEHKILQEVGTMNVFFVVGNQVITPSLEDGTILEGVTRDSAITVLQEMGLELVERKYSIDELMGAHHKGLLSEVFGTGTAATISMIKELRYKEESLHFDTDNSKVAKELKKRLNAIRDGHAPDTHGWMFKI
jgi:hypothetical protein